MINVQPLFNHNNLSCGAFQSSMLLHFCFFFFILSSILKKQQKKIWRSASLMHFSKCKIEFYGIRQKYTDKCVHVFLLSFCLHCFIQCEINKAFQSCRSESFLFSVQFLMSCSQNVCGLNLGLSVLLFWPLKMNKKC